MSSRPYELVLFGATGFTGALVAEHLAAHGPRDLRWALAGRSQPKLAAVRDQLSSRHPHLHDLPLIVADSSDPASLKAMAHATRVIATTVGPYLKYGLPLVQAAAEAGTHYCDLTGEVPFMRRSIDAWHDTARRTGARIVHTCGYDSIPSDLGTLVVQQAMLAQGSPATRVRTVVGPSKGGMSGGTIASAMAIAELATDRDEARKMAHPYALDPSDDRGTADTWDSAKVSFDPDTQRWIAPFFMAPVNTRVVRRSHALLGRPWGPDFSYTEVISTGRTWRGAVGGWMMVGALGLFLATMSRPSGRQLAGRFLPAPGEGPDELKRETGSFRHLVLGQGAAPEHRLYARVVCHKDPGYAGTAIMLGESALCLARDTAQLPDLAGVLTPTTAMGVRLVERLRAAGMEFDVQPWPDDEVPSF
jgi:short subunit dehydrogenase-like uncharacterized protein